MNQDMEIDPSQDFNNINTTIPKKPKVSVNSNKVGDINKSTDNVHNKKFSTYA